MQERLWHKSYAPGVPKTIDYEKVTIPQALRRTAEKFPDHIALNYMGRLLTYREAGRNRSMPSPAPFWTLESRPVTRWPSVCPIFPRWSSPPWPSSGSGRWSFRRNPLYTERELTYQLNDSDARMIVTLTLLVPRIEKINPGPGSKKSSPAISTAICRFRKNSSFRLLKRTCTARSPPRRTSKYLPT